MTEHIQEIWEITQGPASPYFGVKATATEETIAVRMTEANARLLTAAPGGLELAKLVLHHCCMDCVKKQAEKVIAKATGLA